MLKAALIYIFIVLQTVACMVVHELLGYGYALTTFVGLATASGLSLLYITGKGSSK